MHPHTEIQAPRFIGYSKRACHIRKESEEIYNDDNQDSMHQTIHDISLNWFLPVFSVEEVESLNMVNQQDISVDHIILDVFEEQEDTFFFPVESQREARAFVKVCY